MRVSFGGIYTLDEFAEAVGRMLDHFRQAGVEDVFQANIYLRMSRKRRTLTLFSEEGEEIEHLHIDAPAERLLAKAANIEVVEAPRAYSAKAIKTAK